MEDVLTTKDMEEFFLNPTFKTGRKLPETRKPTMGSNIVSFSRAVDMYASKDAATVKPHVHTPFTDPLDEQLYWRGYTSDEEVASADESDTRSVLSTSSGEIVEAVPARNSSSFPDGVVFSMNATERQCHRARAVVLQQIGVGKSGVVSLIDIPASPRHQRKSPISPIRPPVSRLQTPGTFRTHHQSDASDASAPNTSSDNSSSSTPSTPPTSSDEQSFFSSKVVRRKPSMASMRQAPADKPVDLDQHAQEEHRTHAERPSLRLTSRTKPSLHSFASESCHIFSQLRDHASDTIVPSRPRLHKKFFSQHSLHLHLHHHHHHEKRERSAEHDANGLALRDAGLLPPLMPDVYIPRRTSSKQPHLWMVAHGAHERKSRVVLSHRADDREEEEHGRPHTAHARLAPVSYSPTGAPVMPRRLHSRHRSISHEGFFLDH